ncbi:hypothetical protein RvY_00313 [Ramazzottius varieornatus]|uniref:Uncharacterized protein n=1 Tax=Ramazzottius varieornatus TaxID=947166 RepID=A0A1D1UMU2_RAMVA|nr:hypothetical protein RvY_00313 [Ramazzottius varieornatus]
MSWSGNSLPRYGPSGSHSPSYEASRHHPTSPTQPARLPAHRSPSAVPENSQPVTGPASCRLDDSTMKSFRISRTLQETKGIVNSVDFSPTGEHVLTATDDESIVVYECLSVDKPKVHRLCNSKKYGVDNAIYTHSTIAALHSSTKVDDNIRYLNLQENKYISVFSGHTKRVTELHQSPVDDQFLSASVDRTIRLWDHRAGCTGMLTNLDTTPILTIDPEGLIFAAGHCTTRENRIMLYDIRNYQKGSFSTFRYPEESDADWCGMEVSPDGRYLLVNTNGFVVYIMDAFQGSCRFCFRGHANRGQSLKASFTPDSQYVLIGSTDGKLHIWNLRTGRNVAVLAPKQKDLFHKIVKFHPTNALAVSAGNKVSFWLPYIVDQANSSGYSSNRSPGQW